MNQDKFHSLLIKHLKALNDDLKHYEQTTHATLFSPTITNVADYIKASYNDPSAYNISTLAQLINGFSKELD